MSATLTKERVAFDIAALEYVVFQSGVKLEKAFKDHYVVSAVLFEEGGNLHLIVTLSDEKGAEFRMRTDLNDEDDSLKFVNFEKSDVTEESKRLIVEIFYDLARILSDKQVTPTPVDCVEFAPCRRARFGGVRKSPKFGVTLSFTPEGRPPSWR